LAKERHPGQSNRLDALCKRYDVDNSHRELHGALLDAEILADVYLAMTGGQVSLLAQVQGDAGSGAGLVRDANIRRVGSALSQRLTVLAASADELAAHEGYLAGLRKKAGQAVWDA
jgi:DNA polymerase-3 subunit epsilon